MEKEPKEQTEQIKSHEIAEQEKKKLISRLREQIAETKGLDNRILRSLIREINISTKDLDFDEFTGISSSSDLKIDALWYPGEGKLEIKPHFFKNKSEAEQKHILAHEFAHSLEPLIAINPNILRLIESFANIYDSSYIQKVDEKHQVAERTTDIVGAFLTSKTVQEFQDNLIAISNHPDKQNGELHIPHRETIAKLFIELDENIIGKLKDQTPQEIYSMTRNYNFAYDFIEESFDNEDPTWSISTKNIDSAKADTKPNQSFFESLKSESRKFESYGFWGFFK